MPHFTDRLAVNARLLELAGELTAGLNPDFDAHDDLGREFQELRSRLDTFA